MRRYYRLTRGPYFGRYGRLVDRERGRLVLEMLTPGGVRFLYHVFASAVAEVNNQANAEKQMQPRIRRKAL